MTLAALIKHSETDREGWKYTSLKNLATQKFSSVGKVDLTRLPELAPPAHELHRLVFVNGVWQAQLSHLHNLPARIMQGDAVSGYQLTLEGKTCLVTSPLELLFINNVSQPTECNTKLHIVLGDSGRLTLIERHEASEDTKTSVVQVMQTTIELGAQAKLVHGKILHGHIGTVHLAQTDVRAAKGAYYDNFALLSGGQLVRSETAVTLAAEMAQCNLRGIMLLRGTDHVDTTTHVTHAAPHGTSSQTFRTVLDEKARGVFQGKICVQKDAQKTDGHQLSRALLLSDQAEMDAKPELEIHADDVKCSHGNTMGDLDESALFYLRSRGLNENEARDLLIRAFVSELIDEIQAPELRTAVRDGVEDWLR